MFQLWKGSAKWVIIKDRMRVEKASRSFLIKRAKNLTTLHLVRFYE